MKVVGRMGELDSRQMLVQNCLHIQESSGVGMYTKSKRSTDPRCSKRSIVNFVKGESELANEPVFSPDALRLERKNASSEGSGKKNQEKRNSGVKKTGSFVTNSILDSNPQASAFAHSVLKVPAVRVTRPTI